MSTSSRVILFFTIALVACIYFVSAAPIGSSELELVNAPSNQINILNKRRHRHRHNKNNRKAKTTVTTTVTETATTTTTKTATATATTTSTAIKKNISKSSSSSFSGDGTYYGTGLGSCGIESKDSDYIVALNHGQMSNGANPNNNPLCGKKITAKGPSGSVTVTIVDTCPGCAVGDLDLSPAAFSQIADMALGRVPVTWTFN